MSEYSADEKQKGQHKSLNERFTDFADIVSEGMGKWWVTALSILAVLIWFAAGPFFHFSDTWQLIINTPTTVLEMWIGFLIAAAANRVERHNRALLVDQLKITQHIDRTNQEEEQELHAAEQRLQWQDDMMRSVLDHLDQQDHTMMQMLERIDALLEQRAFIEKKGSFHRLSSESRVIHPLSLSAEEQEDRLSQLRPRMYREDIEQEEEP